MQALKAQISKLEDAVKIQLKQIHYLNIQLLTIEGISNANPAQHYAQPKQGPPQMRNNGDSVNLLLTDSTTATTKTIGSKTI